MTISSAEEIIEDIRHGKMVILMDDEDRENEGDILVAAEKITPEAINFMATHGRGLICLTLTKERCEQLKLPLMVKNHTEAFGTNFTISIEAAEGIETGTSAKDRALTVQAAVAPYAKPEDIVLPGHIFPVMAQDGGVLTRAGHTEAGCDVARLAGLTPSSVIVEVLNDDGTMARRPELERFADKHDIKLGTIADLIAYRFANEKTIQKLGEKTVKTAYGEFKLISYQDEFDSNVHFAMVRGDIKPSDHVLVRVHVPDTFSDLLHLDNRRWPLSKAMAKIAEEGGVLVVLSNNETKDSVLNSAKKLYDDDAKAQEQAFKFQFHQVGIGSQILADLGVTHMRLLTASDRRYHALSGFGLDVVEYVSE